MLDAGIMTSAGDVAACQSIRFHVFCRERAILREKEFPNHVEHDEFDDIATHLAVTNHRGTVLGTVRLVPHSHLGFPLERHTDTEIPPEIVPELVEVSRLAVPRADGGERTRLSRAVGLQLFRAVYVAAKRGGWTHLLGLMERPLVRLLASFDIPIVEAGPEVDFAGLVRPYLISVAEFDAVRSERAQFFRTGTNLLPSRVSPDRIRIGESLF